MKSISTSAVSCRVPPNIFIIFFSVARLCNSLHAHHRTIELEKWQKSIDGVGEFVWIYIARSSHILQIWMGHG